MITKMGVKEFSVPVSAPSMPCSAMQNKNAGNRLPNMPDIKMVNIFSLGINLKYFMADGNRTMPEKTIRNAATWYALKLTSPSFINTKLLPQIMERPIKIAQLRKSLVKMYMF